MANYQSLEVWDAACYFAKHLFAETSELTDWGLRDQLRRSAVSIASNIAEGSERGSDREFIRFLRIAKGSGAECVTQLRIAVMTGQLSQTQGTRLNKEAISINKRIGGLIKYFQNRPAT